MKKILPLVLVITKICHFQKLYEIILTLLNSIHLQKILYKIILTLIEKIGYYKNIII